MQRVPVEQRHQHRRRGFDRPVAPALAVGDETDNFVFQHFLEKRRRRVAARQAMALDEFEEPLGKQPGARLISFVAKILRKRRVRHQPALLGRKQRGYPRARPLHRQQRLRLASNASFERRMQQDVVRGHGHG